MALVAIREAPAAPFVPARLRRRPAVFVSSCYVGPPEEGRRPLEALCAFGPPEARRVAPMPYVALQRLFDEAGAFGHRVRVRSDHLTGLPGAAIDALVAGARDLPPPLSVLVVVPLGGAVGRVGEQETAFSHRQAPFDYAAYSLWSGDGGAGHRATAADRLGAAMRPFSLGVYINEMGDEGEERTRAAYHPPTYERLVALKSIYDPGNLFRSNPVLRPCARPASESTHAGAT
jgi:hypothetical protein